MTSFLLNNEITETDLPVGLTVLDFVRYKKNLKGTKIGCREGDCGACTVLVGESTSDGVKYRTMTSCLMPLANAEGKHIVTVEGINPPGDSLTPVQQELVDQSGTQCGFCTVGFVMSMTGLCLDTVPRDEEMSVSAIDGNICRCTGYKSIERAAKGLCDTGEINKSRKLREILKTAIEKGIVPGYFDEIEKRLEAITPPERSSESKVIVGGGTDLYVQKPEEMVEAGASHVFYSKAHRGIGINDGFIEIGASSTVTDMLESPHFQGIFPDLYEHLKLVSSTPIRNMATLAGNFVNASPIGDMTVWFLALDAEVVFDSGRHLPLRKLYKGYKDLDKTEEESIELIRFKVPGDGFLFNFEKVCKRQYLDIATVNTALSFVDNDGRFGSVHVAAGGVAPVPLYLARTSEFLNGNEIRPEIVVEAMDLIDEEINPISDVRGSAEYKRLLLRQLFKAHFVELVDSQ